MGSDEGRHVAEHLTGTPADFTVAGVLRAHELLVALVDGRGAVFGRLVHEVDHEVVGGLLAFGLHGARSLAMQDESSSASDVLASQRTILADACALHEQTRQTTQE